MENLDKSKVLEKEIDLIQSCINRMAHNSFIVKGWMISVLAVLLGVLSKTFNVTILSIVCIIVSMCFWYLDGFFLRLERLYRWKYEWIIKNRMSSNEYYYDLNPYNDKMWLDERKKSKKKKHSNNKIINQIKIMLEIIKVMFSSTLWVIYIPFVIFSIIILIIY